MLHSAWMIRRHLTTKCAASGSRRDFLIAFSWKDEQVCARCRRLNVVDKVFPGARIM